MKSQNYILIKEVNKMSEEETEKEKEGSEEESKKEEDSE